MAKVRNPLAGFGITIASALGFSFFMCVPILFLPQAELVYFYLPFALFGVGAFAGRSGFLGTLGFIGATMGAFLGVYAFQSVFLPQGWPLWFSDWAILMDAAFGACCGIGGLASASSACDGSSACRRRASRCAVASSAGRRSASRPASVGRAGPTCRQPGSQFRSSSSVRGSARRSGPCRGAH